MTFRLSSLLFAFFLLSIGLQAQESKLAEQYFQNGEYQKASQLFQRLYDTQSSSEYYLDRYIDCLLKLKQYKEGEQVLQRELKKNPAAVKLYVSLGKLLEEQDRSEEAEDQYRTAIREMPADQYQIILLGNALARDQKIDLAMEVYDKGAKLLGRPSVFAEYQGNLMLQSGDFPEMIAYYLLYLRENPRQQGKIQMNIQRYLPEEYTDELQAQLYSRINEDPDDVAMIELLTWTFLQKKDYRNALRQSKALDLKLNENGNRIFNLGQIAANERDYGPAIEAFQYLIDQKGPGTVYYYDAKKQLLNAKRKKLVESPSYSQQDLLDLEAEYEQFLGKDNRNRLVAPLIMEQAELEALYLQDLPKAITLLEEVIHMPGIEQDLQSTAKLQLGDYYLMQGEIWDATLLYSQVDKLYKDDPLGHEARFRNARLSYFNGDFQWAQAQFDVLKASTSKLIANDALDLSVFIMDNLGLDTTTAAMAMYADAELLVFQNQHSAALAILDSLASAFPFHSLEDDVLYLKSRIYTKDREWNRAETVLQRILDEYPEEIRADNALYDLGQLYEGPLGDPAKAMACYERIFTDYSNSTFAVDARKRFRFLRGDHVQ